MNYKKKLQMKLQKQKVLKKEIKLLKELISLEDNKNNNVIYNQKVSDIDSGKKYNDWIYNKEQLKNIGIIDLRELLQCNICKISYIKKDGSYRVFEECSMNNEYITNVFKQNTKNTQHLKEGNLFIIENDFGDFQIKQIIFDQIAEVQILETI